MPRPKIDLDAWQGTIEQRLNQGQPQHEILQWLAGEGIVVSRSTFTRILQAWGTQSNYTKLRIRLQDPVLYTTIHNLLYQQQLSDA